MKARADKVIFAESDADQLAQLLASEVESHDRATLQ
jgi:hypothetical protein